MEVQDSLLLLNEGKQKRNPAWTFEETHEGKVVLDMMKHLDIHGYRKIYMDNFFTSYHLLVYMKNLGIRHTGTKRPSRTAKCPTTK